MIWSSIFVWMLTTSAQATQTEVAPQAALANPAIDAENSIGAPLTVHYTPKDYQLDATVLSLTLADEELLIAAENGLVSHAAGFFEIQENTRHLAITAKDTCDGKRIYAGSIGSIGTIEKDATGEWRYEEIAIPDLIMDSQVWSVVCHRSRAYYVTNHAVFVVQGRQLIQTIRTDLWLNNVALMFDRVVVAVRDDGLREVTDDGRLLDSDLFAPLRKLHVHCIGNLADSAIIFAQTERGIFQYQNQSIKPVQAPQLAELLKARPYVAKKTAQGLAVGALNGEIWWLSSKLQQSMRVSLSGSGVLDLAVDQEYSTWAATERGLYRIQWPAMWTEYGQAQGLQGNPKAVIRYQNKLWLAASNGVFTVEGNQLQPIGIPGEQAFGFVLAADDLLINYGVGIYSVKAKQLLAELNEHISDQLVTDPDSDQFLTSAGGDGVSRYQWRNGKWQELWHLSDVGPAFGLLALSKQHQALRFLIKREKPVMLLLDDALSQPRVESLVGLPKARAYDFFNAGEQIYATTEHQRFRLVGRQFVLDDSLAIPLDAQIFAAHTTLRGHQWFAGAKDIFYQQANSKDINKVALPSQGMHITCMQADGASMLFCDQLALLRLRPFNAVVLPEQYHVRLASLKSGNLNLPLNARIELQEQDSLTARFIVNTQFANVRFRARGFTDPQHIGGWGDPRVVDRWSLTGLAPGKNYFEVQASVNDGEWSQPYRLEIHVPGRWWQLGAGRYLAIALLLVAMSSLVAGFVAWRNRSLAHRAMLLTQMVDERTRSLSEKTEALEKANRTLSELALKDGLTLVGNRRKFDSYLDQALRDALANPAQSVVLCLMDLDHFKQYNDHFGHIAGDDLLRRFAGTLEQLQLQHWPDGLLARYGGEEFALVLCNCSMAQARDLAERMRWRVQQDFARVGVTVSIGIAVAIELASNRLIERADAALYRAKKNGRNCVVFDESMG